MPLVFLSEAIGLYGHVQETPMLEVMIAGLGTHDVGLVVDEIRQHYQVVVKPLDGYLAASQELQVLQCWRTAGSSLCWTRAASRRAIREPKIGPSYSLKECSLSINRPSPPRRLVLGQADIRHDAGVKSQIVRLHPIAEDHASFRHFRLEDQGPPVA